MMFLRIGLLLFLVSLLQATKMEAVSSTALSFETPPAFQERFRPQFHLSPPLGEMSDPNGMVYFEGEYHQFYQHHGEWGHAVSRDLVHWQQLPLALARDELGSIWSGSTVVDEHDTSGFFGGKAGLVAIFTHAKKGLQSQSLAYSQDRGRTWTKYAGNPVLPNPGLKDFRDPKVFWYTPSQSWVMVVAVDQQVRFYASSDLKHWQMTGEFGQRQGSHAAVWECPDLFELPVEGSKVKQWVLTVSVGNNITTHGSTAQYFVGHFNGRTFLNANAPSTVLWTDYGRDFYAAVSYSGIPARDGRRIWLGWMSNWRYPFAMPTESWKGNLSIPRSLILRNVEGQGIRLIQTPIKELAALRGKPVRIPGEELHQGHNPLDGIKGTAYCLETEFTLASEALITFRLRKAGDQETVVAYDAGKALLSVDRTRSGLHDFEASFAEKVSAPLRLQNRCLRLRIFVDACSVEVFANDGEVVLSNLIFPDPASVGLELATSGDGITLNRATYYPMHSIWQHGRLE